jgi:lysophospholipid hydrolase
MTDLTWPIVAYTTGHEFNRSLYKCFYDSHIEDMWLPFFCNSTNILDSCQEIHDSGWSIEMILGIVSYDTLKDMHGATFVLQ